MCSQPRFTQVHPNYPAGTVSATKHELECIASSDQVKGYREMRRRRSPTV